jgi:Zn-dependent metalloprotease
MTKRRARRVFAAVAITATCTATVSALSTPAALAAPTPSAAVPAGLTPVVTLHSLLGTHSWYRQTFHGLPVLDAFYVRHFDKSGRLIDVDDGRQSVPSTLSTRPSVASTTAAQAAGYAVTVRAAQAAKAASPVAADGGQDLKAAAFVPGFGAAHATLAVVGGSSAALVWSVVSKSDSGEMRTLVDAHSGVTRAVTVLSKNADGTGNVFDPNPVVALRNESLRDKADADQAVLDPAYKRVTLQRLGAGPTLSGKYATVVSARNGLATSANHQFVYTRHDDRFEQVNAYYGIDKAQAYIQSLGFNDVNNRPQPLNINTIPVDNSFYDSDSREITYGKGGVDDAEDLEVVWHEYGHAIQDAQVPGFGESEQAGSIGEGFGDYWAVTMSEPTSNGFDLPCVMDWDSTSYTSTVPHCLRRTDTGKTTDDVDGEVHDDGEIWSNALWDINQAVGRNKANQLILEAQFDFTPTISFAKAAKKTVAVAQSMFGTTVANQVTAAFHARKIL